MSDIIAMSKMRAHLISMLRDAWPWLPPEDLCALFAGAALELEADMRRRGRPFDHERYREGVGYGREIMSGVLYELLRMEADG